MRVYCGPSLKESPSDADDDTNNGCDGDLGFDDDNINEARWRLYEEAGKEIEVEQKTFSSSSW